MVADPEDTTALIPAPTKLSVVAVPAIDPSSLIITPVPVATTPVNPEPSP